MIKHYIPNTSQALPAFQPNDKLRDPALYHPQPELVDAVNVALTLGLPLLLTGEPGSGKTELAKHLAWHFKLGDLLRLDVQSTSTSNDLFYRYDALGHFQYNQNSPHALSKEELEKRFIRYVALGEAIKSDARRVVLIDEIDKAPRDFPNDVLAALEELTFYVPEIDTRFTAKSANQPLVVLTSNSEKNLPDAFLRRVAYHHISFPGPERLLAIVSAKVAGYSKEQLEPLIDHFLEIRSSDYNLKKIPATAELIQWAYFLQSAGFDPAQLEQSQKSAEVQGILHSSYAVLAKTKEDLAALRKQAK